MSGVIREMLQSLFEPKPIYSRHKAKDILGEALDSQENFVFGLDKRDSLFKRRRTYWFITETKLVFIRHGRLLRQNRYIYHFDMINDMRVFDEEGILVIQSVGGEERVSLDTEEEHSFAGQAIEQYNRIQRLLEAHTEKDDDSDESVDESDTK